MFAEASAVNPAVNPATDVGVTDVAVCCWYETGLLLVSTVVLAPVVTAGTAA